MSNVDQVFGTENKTVASRFKISFEIVLIYIMTGLIILTFFNAIQRVLYASLGYLALFMFLSVFVVMVSYTLYNFAKGIFNLMRR